MGELAKVGLVFLGAGLGGVARFLIQTGAERKFPAFPWGTMAINVAGSLLIGLFLGWSSTREGDSHLRSLIATGLLGGFTTFSAFSAEAVKLGQTGQALAFMGYVAGSVVLSLLACTLGVFLTGSRMG